MVAWQEKLKIFSPSWKTHSVEAVVQLASDNFAPELSEEIAVEDLRFGPERK